jgi:hypothetical protein
MVALTITVVTIIALVGTVNLFLDKITNWILGGNN